jgi:hypothetical protein
MFCPEKVRGQYKSSREKVVKNSVKDLHRSIGFSNHHLNCDSIASEK